MDNKYSLQIFDSTLGTCKIELLSDKSAIRNKAFAQLQDFLDRRSDEIHELVKSNEYKSDTTWESLFNAALDGIVIHVEQIKSKAANSALINKCALYEQVVKRLVEVANNQIEDHISKKVILEKCSSLLNDNSDMIKYFGDCLLTLVDDHIAKSKGVWYKIKCDDYKQWINRLFGYLINDQNHIPKAKIIACLSSGILAGLQNLNIASALNSFMEPITVKIVTASNEYEKINLMKIAYMIAFETIANNRVETSKCLMEISKVIFKNYNARFVRDDQRSCITKILDLAIETQIITDDDAKLLSEDDFGLLLENCFNFVEQEIARMDHALGNVVTDSIFIDFATKVCTLSLWNDFTWTSSNCNEQPHKKMKFLNKFPALISRTEGTSSNRRQVNKYSWRWILILCKITEKHPELITNDDYETILQLLSDFQTRIQKPEEFYGFYIGVKSLLDYEKKNQTCINQKQLNEYWENISKNAVRNCCSINPVSNENLLLLRLILIHKQHKGEQFIESLLGTYFTDSIRRSNDSIHTLITILLTFNIHIFKDVDAKVEKILAFLLCKKMNEKKLLSEKFFDKADPVLIAKCVVLCNLHKTTFNESIKSEWLEESVNFGLDKWETDEYKIYVRALNSIKDAILIQLNHKPIIETIEKNEGKNSSPLLSQESVVVIDETSFGSFCAKILPAESQMACSQTTDDQESVPDLMQDKMYKLAIVIHTFNFFIKVNAVSRETFDKFRLSKLIGIIIPTLEEDFGELDASENYHKKIEMMKLLKEIFNPNFCQVVMKIVRNVTWTKCLTWVANVLKKGGDLEELGQDKFMTLKRLPLEIFAAFLSENGKDVARAETFFRNCLSDDGKILNFESCSIDACIFLDVFLILNQSKRISEPIAIDGLNCMVKILKSQYQNIKIVDKLLKIVPVYLNFYKQFAEETSRVTITVLGLVQAAKHYYPLHVIRKILGLIKFYVKAYPTEDAKKICDHIYYFLKSNCVYILASAGQAYINMINPNWVQNLSESNVQEIEYVFEDAVDFYLKKLAEMTEENVKAPIVMICTQLFPTVICTNFKLRNKAIMAFLDFCNVVNLPSNKMKTFFNMLNESCGNGCDVTKYFKDDLQRILTHWVAKEYPFAKFPYYITGEASLDDFLTTNCKTMSIAFFISNENLVQKLCQSTNKSEEMLMREVMPELLVEILPILSSTENYTPEQNQKAKELAIKIKNVPNSSILLQEAINHILELLIQRFMDRDFTQKYLQTTINSRNDTHDQLTLQQLDCCSNYLKRQVQGNKSEKSLFLIMCENTPYCIQKLLLSIESRLDASNSEEQKITCLSQYIFVFEHVKIFIKSNNNINLSKFFVINMVHFMCNQINGADEQVSKAAFFYFNHTCDDLIQTEFESFKTCLSFIVHTLVQNVVSSGNSQKIVKFLQKLLITEKKLFESEIVLLPDFPKKAEFQLLQDNLTAVRNQLEQNTLLAQIEQFFQIQFKTVETLNSLHASLASKKLELVEMYKEASSIKFSDQTEKSVLHRLVNKLVAIVEGPDETKAYEAAKCLGELGPADLYTLALYRENDNILYKLAVDSNDAESCIHQQLLDCLQDLIFDKNIKIKKVANEILIQVMSSVIGQSFKDEWPLFEIFILSASPKFGSVLKLDNTAANMNITNIFVQTRVEDYKTWIQQVCGKLFTLFGNEQINNLIKLLPELAETLLASAIKLCFTLNNDALLSALNNEINNFFSEFYAATQTSDKFYQNTLIVKTMLMVYECCRVQEKDNIIPKIKPNYLHLIKASEYCKAYFSCILYSQLWSSTEAISNKAISNVFYNVKLNKEIATSLQKAYHAIGIQDAENYLVDPLENRENYLIQRGAWSQVLLEQPLCNPYIWMENGFYESAYKMYGSEYKEIAFENLWRLSEWTIFDQDEPTENLNTTFQKSHYESLRCLHTTDKTGIKKHIRDARFSVIEMIKKTAAECPKNLYKLFGYLEMLQQIDDIYLVRIEKGDPEILLAKWAMNDNLPKTEFELVEMKLSQRVALLKECGVVANRSWVPKILPNTIFDVIRTAVQADKLNIAIKNISKMKALGKDLDRYFDSMLKLQDAQLNWKLNNCKLSKMILNDLLDRNETPILVKIEANFLMGHYEKGNTSIEVAMNTYNKYFKEAHSLLVKYAKNQNLLEELRQGIYRNDKTGNHLKDLSKIFGTIAKFFDEQQTALNKYFKSEEYTKKKNVLARLEYTERALQVCREKINGSGFFETCTVEHQVDNLIEEARSMENLSRLFNGWQAYL
uniref:CSON008049 protein n=1 Tax=Culicoides sonorensis TaxID=179676 RepID=A0A336N0J5_CULSO